MPAVSLGLGPVLVAGPLAMLASFAASSFVLGAQRVPPEQIPEAIVGDLPYHLLVVQFGLALAARSQGRTAIAEAWRMPAGRPLAADLALGAVVGIAIAVLYLRHLESALAWFQVNAGDYVPPGSVRPALSSSIGAFFVANVVLAPAVEETVYRGLALPRLERRFGSAMALVLSCVFFGLLHWAGGFWYMALTGAVAGGAFGLLWLRRRGIWGPFAAHLTLNAIEFADAWRTLAGGD